VPKEEVIHKDILGQPLHEGNYVAVSHRNIMYVCQIKKLTPKMMRVVPIKNAYHGDEGWLKYDTESVLLSGPDALAYILTNFGK
jgi:hypothetical protein